MNLEDYLFECTVRVEADGRSGTGFVIAPGLVLTAAHLVEDPVGGNFPMREVAISHRGSRSLARVVRYAASPDPDLAVLEADDVPTSAVYLYNADLEGDALYVCGMTEDGSPLSLRLESSIREAIREGDVMHLRGALPPLLPKELEGAPVLNLRTGGVTALVIGGVASPDPGGNPACLAVSVGALGRLFPDIRLKHDQYHEQSSGWFATTGVRGTVFAAREHILATRDTCETPIQPLITPGNGRTPMELSAPIVFQPPFARTSSAGRGLETSIEEVLERSRTTGRSVLLTGPTGSGRSSVLRAVGYRAAVAFRNLGTLDQNCLFPILLRANQLATDGRPVEDVIIASMEQGNEVMTGIDLPPTFLTDVARSPGVHLLLMIDGMDEIQNSRDIVELVDLIGRIQQAPGFGHRTQLLVTARPSAAEHFRYAPFDVFEVQPLGEDAIRQAAGRWLGDPTGFLRDNADLVASGRLSSPLVLAVALKLYETSPRVLPRKVVELYRTLISNLARERRDELAGKYGAEVADNAVDLLGFVALELLRSGKVMDETWVRTTAARYLEQQVGLDSARARASAESFTHFAAADSHFIGPAGSRFFWSHLSFRDYFAASCLVRLPSVDGDAITEIRRRWFDSSWGRTPSFALQLLESESARREVLADILASGRPARLAFMTDLLREGAELPPELVREFLDALVATVREERKQGSSGEWEPATLDLLLSLSHLPEARKALGEFEVGVES